MASVQGSQANDNGFHGSQRLQELAAGIKQFVRFDRTACLRKVMDAIGAAQPEFSVVELGDSIVKVRVKLDLSSLISKSGQRVQRTTLESGTFLDRGDAQESAVVAALRFLDENYMIKIHDYSTRVISEIGRFNANELVVGGIRSAKDVLDHLFMIGSKCNLLLQELRRKQCCDHFSGPSSDIGKVYEVACERLSCILGYFENKANEARSDFDELKSDWTSYEERAREKAQKRPSEGSGHHVFLDLMDLLGCVMSFYWLDRPEYISKREPDGLVSSKVTFEFPYIERLQFCGKLEREGKSYSSPEANEEAAFQALLFIEKYCMTRLIDYNYTKRQKSVKEIERVLSMVERVIEFGESLNKMFGKVINAIQVQRRLFQFDPSTFFTGEISVGQIAAYQFCGNGLCELENQAERFHASCEQSFHLLQELTWKLIAAKTNLPL